MKLTARVDKLEQKTPSQRICAVTYGDTGVYRIGSTEYQSTKAIERDYPGHELVVLHVVYQEGGKHEQLN